MKKFAIMGLIALIHFAASVAIIAISMSAAPAIDPTQVNVGFRVLVALTRILHFPIISLSWYSRQWFPGDWIYVPMAVNSMIWAAAFWIFYSLVKELAKRINHGR
ncbi:MAG: hypothetical protein QNJ58_01015 [Desulfobacterales bacterium]|nr:hypothetical protein [Desulfobacterales bacterium]